MTGRSCVLGRVTMRGAVATMGTSALLAGAQMHPRTGDLHAFLALHSRWPLDDRDCLDVSACGFGHDGTRLRIQRVDFAFGLLMAKGLAKRGVHTSQSGERLAVAEETRDQWLFRQRHRNDNQQLTARF
jgi:hypothetical protein